MALDISGATLGYDRNGLTKLIEDIQVNCIEETITAINDGMEFLLGEIENVWVGHSANGYRRKLEEDRDKVTSALQKVGEQIQTDLAAAIAQIDSVDQSITF